MNTQSSFAAESRAELANNANNAHEVRITSSGDMNAWVDHALKFFEEHEDQPVTFHTLPNRGQKRLAVNAVTEESTVPQPKSKLDSSTTLIPRLISVVEIIKREYVKKLDPAQTTGNSLLGLHQYNELGTLDEPTTTDGKEQNEEERRDAITAALQSRNNVKIKKTAYMKITLSRKQLTGLDVNVTHQPPSIRKLSKAARNRAKRRIEKEKQAE